MAMQTYRTVDQYISSAPVNSQPILRKLRKIVTTIAPSVEERISYGIPTYKVGKKVIHFGGYDKHISLYPGAAGVANFSDRLHDYDTSKGTIRFYLDKPIPYDFIEDIVFYCLVLEN